MSSSGGLGQLEEVTQEGNTTRLVVKRPGGGPNLVIQITNDGNQSGTSAESSVHATNVLSQLLKAVAVSEEKKGASGKADAAASEDKTVKAEQDETNLTPLMKAAKSKDGNLVRKEIIQLRKRNNRNDGGDVAMLEKLLDEVERQEIGDEKVDSAASVSSATKSHADNTANINSGLAPKRDSSSSSGWAAIHFACDNANHEGLRYLLEAGANPNLTERMGATPLHLVILAAGRYPLEQKLMNGENVGSPFNLEKNDSGDERTYSFSRPTLPGVVKTKSGARAKEDGYEYLVDFMKCAKLLLDNTRFDLMRNERREDEYNASKPLASSSFKKGKFDPILQCLPEDDGFGISPLCLCVCQGYTGRDALYPLLELLLTRGFDPNAKLCGFSALQIALRNMHYGCAFALTRAGANVNEPHREDGKTALQAAELIFGDVFARELREASVVALAVADPTRRRDMLRSMGADGAKKLAKRAMNAGHSFIKASRWREAAGAYTEAALYGPDALGKCERFECLRNMSECYLQVERGLKAEEVAKTLVKEFPKVSLAMVVLGEAMSHPSSGKLTSDQLKQISKLADDALNLEKKSDGKEWWRTLEPKSNTTLFRILKLKGLVEGRSKEQNPAVKFANTALDEYFTVGGSIEKAAFAIELALKPDLKHPSPLPLHGIRGFIYYSWASEILRANSLNRLDRETKEGFQRVMAPLKNKLTYKDANDKVNIAFNEFEYYNKLNVKGEFPKLMYGFNIAKTNFAIGKFQDGKKSALISIRERTEADLVRLADNTTHRKSASEAAQDDHFEGGSTQKLILQLNWALDMYRMLITQMVVDWAVNLDATNPADPPFSIEPEVMRLKLKEDAINSQHLNMIFEKMKSFKMMDRTSVRELQGKISGSPQKVNTAIRGLLSAMKKIESGHKIMRELRVEVAKVIMDFVMGAYERQKQNKSSSRVIGSLLMESYEWDKNVVVPNELPKIYLKMAQEFAPAQANKKSSRS
eukprot:CCRYP_008286-RA/>CCRYP_008286-RA protein AED:0.03 eAED:0.03 QI:37/1/1/1/1/1/3/137/986